MRFRILGLVLALVCSAGWLNAQKIDKGHISIGASGRWDHIHSSDVAEKMLASYDFGAPVVDIGFSSYPSDNDWFARAFNYPTFGLAFGYTPMGSLSFKGDSRMGDVWDFYGWGHFYLLQTRRFRTGPSVGLGKAYTGVIYHWRDNPGNLYFGSHWQNIVCLGWRAEVLLSSHLSAELIFDFQHHSNGMWRAPNRGINEWVTGLGLRYYLAPTEFPSRGPKLEKPLYKKGLSWRIFSAFGTHSCQLELEANLASGKEENLAPLRPVIELGSELVWRYTPIFATGVFIDATYNTDSNRENDLILKGREDPQGYSPFRLGVGITQEVWYKRVSGHVSYGVYVFKRCGLTEDISKTYFKLGFRYHFRRVKGLFAGFDLRAHYMDRAYSMEWGLGYSL